MHNNVKEKSVSRFSYLIRPTTPCIFGTENYNDESVNDDEFFVTAGGIVHSCPNIYELSSGIDYEHRKIQSYDNLIFLDKETVLIHNNLNTYDTEFDRYSILPRFQPISSSSLSTDSISSEIELYKERHAIGLSRRYNNTTSNYSSFLPTIWKSDNYLLFTSIDNTKRSRSYDIPISQTFSSIAV